MSKGISAALLLTLLTCSMTVSGARSEPVDFRRSIPGEELDLPEVSEVTFVAPMDLSIRAPRGVPPGSTATVRVSLRQRGPAYVSVGGARAELPALGREKRVELSLGPLDVALTTGGRAVVHVTLEEGPADILSGEELYFDSGGTGEVTLRVWDNATVGSAIRLRVDAEYMVQGSIETSLGTVPFPVIKVPAPGPSYISLNVTERATPARRGGAAAGLILLAAACVGGALAYYYLSRGEEPEGREGGEDESAWEEAEEGGESEEDSEDIWNVDDLL